MTQEVTSATGKMLRARQWVLSDCEPCSWTSGISTAQSPGLNAPPESHVVILAAVRWC